MLELSPFPLGLGTEPRALHRLDAWFTTELRVQPPFRSSTHTYVPVEAGANVSCHLQLLSTEFLILVPHRTPSSARPVTNELERAGATYRHVHMLGLSVILGSEFRFSCSCTASMYQLSHPHHPPTFIFKEVKRTRCLCKIIQKCQ